LWLNTANGLLASNTVRTKEIWPHIAAQKKVPLQGHMPHRQQLLQVQGDVKAKKRKEMTVQKHTDIVNPITDLDTSHCSPPQPLPPPAAASTAAPAASESTTPCPPFLLPPLLLHSILSLLHLLLSEKGVQKSAKLFHCNLANP
jgi:hypothetical protein